MKKINSKNPECNIHSKNLTNESYVYMGLDNTFLTFKSVNDIYCLIFTNEEKSIICFDITNDKKVNEIKNAHEFYIINFRHQFDKKEKRDLILSISCYDNNIKLWNINSLECLLNIKNENEGGESLSCFLNNNEYNYIISINYISTSNNSSSLYKINTIDFNGKIIQEMTDYNNRTFFIDSFYDKELKINYIITGNEGYSKSYNFQENKMYHQYFEKDNRGHHSIIIYNDIEIIKLIESSFDGNIRIWNFHSGILLNKITTNNISNAGWLYGICLWNNDYLFVGCYKGIIKVIDLKKGAILKELKEHKEQVICIKNIKIPKFGDCLISQGYGSNGIKLWPIDIS